MRKLLILNILASGLSATPCHAQSAYDMIQQLLLDVKKLESLKATLNEMYKGYEILDKGYTEIKDLAKGRLDLHKHFLDGLLKVSPAVRNDSRSDAILDEVEELVATYRQMRMAVRTAGVFTMQELDYFDAMYNVLYQHSQQTLEEMTMVMTDGELRMTDAQRLRAISRMQKDAGGSWGRCDSCIAGLSCRWYSGSMSKMKLNF